jgi:hypothetical protein
MIDHEFRVYDEDRALWEELGLRRVGLVPAGDWIDLGTVEHRPGAEDGDSELWARIKVEACLLPARFWRFTVTAGEVEDVHPVVLETGSGSLSDYWPTVLHVANGCLTFKPVIA